LSAIAEVRALSSVSSDKLAQAFQNMRSIMAEPQWDTQIFGRFLAKRLPPRGDVGAAELARLVEELVGDLKQGTDSRTGKPFPTPMLNDRADLLYNHIRRELVRVGRALADDGFADELNGALEFVEAPAQTAEKAVESG